MRNLREIIKQAAENKTAIGHFNISDLTGFKAIFEAAGELNLPVIIGTSEGEANFLGRKQAAALVKSCGFPIFLNSDHTRSLEEVKKAVEAGYDAILFDSGKLSLEENIKKTKEVVDYAKSINPDILIEGELGYIGASSKVFKEIPEGVSIKPEDLTTPEQAEKFIKETGVNLLAPAVGNIHGIIRRTHAESTLTYAENPSLDIERIRKIRQAAGVPLVLHGGSGIKDEDFIAAIEAGISVIHINTEIRIAWRKGLEQGLKDNPEEIAPYKILPEAVEEIKNVVKARLQLFNGLV